MKRGFTLVELLAVIVLLSVLASIVLFSVGSIVSNSKKSLTNNQIETIEKAAQTYYLKEGINDNNNNACIPLEFLIYNGYIEDDKIENFSKNNEMNGYVKITYKANQYSYEYEEGECPKSFEEKIICKLVSGISKTVGSKYSCDFGAGAKNFYILELGTNPVSNTTLESDEVALILEGNYDTTTQAWCDQSGANPSNNVCAADGLTAKLDEIASAWTELERDQIGLPSAEQIMVADGKSEDAYTGYPSLSNAWLYNWPDNADYGNSAPYGYWTSSPSVGASYGAWFVGYGGDVDGDDVRYDDFDGVRPVIIVSKDSIE